MIRKVFWLSFADPEKPKGKQFLGACLIAVTAEDALRAARGIAMQFPNAAPDAEWLAAAIRKTHVLGINPGGEVLSVEINDDNHHLHNYTFDVLMDQATVERIEKENADG